MNNDEINQCQKVQVYLKITKKNREIEGLNCYLNRMNN